MPAPMKFNFSFARPQTQPTKSRDDDSPLRILILGNFSGAGPEISAQTRLPLRQRPSIRIDIDRFDEVMCRLAPRLRPGGNETSSSNEELEFLELEDFRPERLGQKLKTFRQLYELRQKLLNPATFAQAAAELRQGLLSHTPILEQPAGVLPSESAIATEDDASLLERLLGQPATSRSATVEGRPAEHSSAFLERFIEQAVTPYIVPKADPHQDVYLAAVDNAMGDLMREVLHAPSFQALEVTWRSLHKLISNIENDGQIQIFLLDVTSEELLTQVPTNDEQMNEWSFYRRLTDTSSHAIGAAQWSLIIGDFCIGANPNDLGLLSALAITAEHLRTPLIASAHSSLLGCRSLLECPDPLDWQPLDAEIS